MQIPLSEYPGRHERHFRRKINNQLFPRPIIEYSDDDLLEVQRLDHEEIIAFITDLRKYVEQAANLESTEESEKVLDLKAELEKLYETACRLGDQQANNKSAIRDLLKIIMHTIRQHAGGDSKAEAELEQEAMAREQHFAMLDHQLFADLLDPESLIMEDELAAVMLTEDLSEVSLALTLLNEEQRFLLATEAQSLLSGLEPESTEKYLERINLIRKTT
jgi:preprotein translocase subunit SecA